MTCTREHCSFTRLKNSSFDTCAVQLIFSVLRQIHISKACIRLMSSFLSAMFLSHIVLHSRLVLSPFITVVANYFCFVFLTIYSWVVVERGQQDHGIILLRDVWNQSYAWFPPFRCHSAVAVSPLPLRKFRKNYVSAVRITLLMWKIPLRRCRFHLPLRRNCHSVAIAFWSLHPYVYGKTFPAFPFSPAMATVATEWKNGNDTTAMAEPQPLSLTFPVAVNQSINQLIFIVA